MTNSTALWYLTRGTGLVTLVLLTTSVVLGVVTSVRWSSPRWPRFVTAALHRNVSLLVMAFVSVHIVTAVLDSFAPIRWIDVVIPFGSRYRPIWLGLGAVAFDLLVAVVVTSLLRQHIGHRVWRAIHWAAYVSWPVALVHALGTGTDVRVGWGLALDLGSLAAVLGAVWWRLGAAAPTPSRRLGVVASIALPATVLAWAVAGPLQSGWSRRAGTPPTLLASAAGAAGAVGVAAPGAGSTRAGAAPAAKTAALLDAPFSARLQGSLRQSGGLGDGQPATVVINGALDGGVVATLRLVLQGTAVSGGGVRMSQSSATLGPPSQPRLYQGEIVALDGDQMLVSLARSDGHAIRLRIGLQVDQAGGTVSGVVEATAGSAGRGGDD